MNDATGNGLQGRISAHRRVLAWLISELPADKRARLAEALAEPFPPQDGQEDPGAVPVSQFADMASHNAELRTLLEAAG